MSERFRLMMRTIIFLTTLFAACAYGSNDVIKCTAGDEAHKSGQIQGSVEFDISYVKNDTSKATVSFKLTDSDTSLNCSSTITAALAVFDITFMNNQFNLTLTFKTVDEKFELMEVSLMYDVNQKNFPDARDIGQTGLATWTKSVSGINAGVNTTFQCIAGMEMMADKDSLNDNVTLALKNAKLEPFHYEKDFGKVGNECPADKLTTSTVAPTPMPTPATGNWTVKEGNTTCIMMDAGIRMWYNHSGEMTMIDVPKTAYPSGNCSLSGGGDQSINLIWKSIDGSWTAQFIFSDSKNHTKVEDGTQYKLYRMCLTDDKGDDYCDDDVVGVYAKAGDSYQCLTAQNYSTSGGTLKVELVNAHLQAYVKEGVQDFGNARICPADNHTNDIVPIIVGACLAALVVIVLIAYLIGRARAKRSTGYESV